MGLIVFEDDHLLVAAKPAGWNTHSPAPYAGEGLYEWLKNREPRWSNLAIIHRLDKETSGLILFGKTTAANRSLTDQFAKRQVRKKYLLRTRQQPPKSPMQVRTGLVRVNERYVSRPVEAGGEIAETRFRTLSQEDGAWLVEAEPLTGKTHQIRVHAAANGFPIIGDPTYGGEPAQRVCLHAAEIEFSHPVSNQRISFAVPADFSAEPRMSLRNAFINPAETNTFRLIHGAADGWPGFYLDQLGDFLLAQSARKLTEAQLDCIRQFPAHGVYYKRLQHEARDAPQWLSGGKAPEEILIRENGLQFSLRFAEGYSTGIFLDQRDNRRRLLTGYIAPKLHTAMRGKVLNIFAYTCAFSVMAAKAGAHVTSLDLSTKYLEWGRRNFEINGLEPASHDLLFGDAFDWMRRLAKKNRLFDTIILDPPTFSRSKESGVFQVEKDFGKLVEAALPLLKPGGILLASSNCATWTPEKFLRSIDDAAGKSKRKIVARQYIPQPPDFPVHRSEPAYLKTVWLLID